MGAVHLGRWFGIKVNVHWSVLIIAVLLASSLASRIGPLPAVVGVVLFLGSILVHEFAHALTARRFDVGTMSIQLWALGGVARLDRPAPTARAEGWIAAAGPIASVVLGGVAVAVWSVSTATGTSGELVAVIGWIGLVNAALAGFNLLPGAPLDGGRIVKAVRWAQHGDRHRAAREAGQAGVVVGWLMGGVGFGLVLRDQSGTWLIITGLFIAINARVEMSAADLGARLGDTRVRDVAWFGVARAGPDMDADSMLWQRQRLGGAGGVAITDDSGVLTGVVLEDDLWAVPADERPWVLLTSMMVPIDRTTRASPDETLTDVLPRIDPRRPVVTVWQQDRLVGLVPPNRLRERLGLS